MNENNLLNVTDEIMKENMISLIKDEDADLSSGAGYGTVVSTITAVSALLQVTTACTTRCWRP